jgi:hypothetical protein
VTGGGPVRAHLARAHRSRTWAGHGLAALLLSAFAGCRGTPRYSGPSLHLVEEPSTIPAVAASAFDAHIVIAWKTAAPGAGMAVRYARSVDGGMSFSPPATAAVDSSAPAPADAPRPALLRDPDGFPQPFLAWQRSTADGHAGALAWTYTIDGTTFSRPSVLPGADAAAGDVHLALARGTTERVITAWIRPAAAPGRSATVMVGSNDGRLPAFIIGADACPDAAPALIAVGDTVVVGWWVRGAEIRLARSTDGGRNFSQAVAAPAGPAAGPCPAATPALAIDSTGTVHVAWTSGNAPRAVLHVALSHGAEAFTPLRTIAATGGATEVALAADRTGLVVAWASPDDGGVVRVARARVDAAGGMTLTAPLTMPGVGRSPALVSGRDLAELAWISATAAGTAITVVRVP